MFENPSISAGTAVVLTGLAAAVLFLFMSA
jgi:hypothetical protein